MIYVEEAIIKAKQKGLKVSKGSLAEKIWSKDTPNQRAIKMWRLCKNEYKSIKVEWVAIVCDHLQCTPNELFGVRC